MMAVTDALLLSQYLNLVLLCRNQFLLLCKKKVFHSLRAILEAADKSGAGASSSIDVEPTSSASSQAPDELQRDCPCWGMAVGTA